MRVLVVEDEGGVAQFLKQGLSEAGYAVDCTEDGEEGLAFALGTSYDLALVDIMLPHMSGIELLRELRAKGGKLPVILLTALDRTEDKVKGLDAGADDYLVKPFAMTELLARIRALLRR
ncbi:MAG TPA: response regulator, partial [Spirochaetia bacterium]|nr:response regulator [Spirochaetia bacterium]